MSVKKSTQKAFNELPPVFGLLDLIRKVRRFTGRHYLTDGTITRRLRELRSDENSNVNYKVIDNHKSIYQKI